MGLAVPLSVDVKEVTLVPNLAPDLAVKTPSGPQMEEDVDLCKRAHSLLAFTLQMVFLFLSPPTVQLKIKLLPVLSPVTVHLKVKVSPGQVGGAAVNCPVTTSGKKPIKMVYQ